MNSLSKPQVRKIYQQLQNCADHSNQKLIDLFKKILISKDKKKIRDFCFTCLQMRKHKALWDYVQQELYELILPDSFYITKQDTNFEFKLYFTIGNWFHHPKEFYSKSIGKDLLSALQNANAKEVYNIEIS